MPVFLWVWAEELAIASTAMICDIVAPKNRGKIFGANSFVINIFTFGLPPLAAILLASIGSFWVSILGIMVAAVVILAIIIVSPKPMQK